jgi:D-ornithine/D-lysine decarboxylase
VGILGPHLSYRDGHLTFDDVDLVEMAGRLPTPFFVYSAARIAENIATLRAAFQSRHSKTEVFFASKACSLLWVLEQARKAGVNVEVNSGGELWKALLAGFAGEQIVFNGVAKSRAEIEQAVTAGIRAIVVDSFAELERVNDVALALGRPANVALRIDVRVQTETHPEMRTAHGGKFGVDIIDAAELFAEACARGPVRVRGLHLHIGSQITTVEPYVRAVEKAFALIERLEASCGERLEFLDIGGGYPVPYVDAADACDAADYFCATTTPDDYAEQICALVERLRPDLTLAIEPGRYVVSDAAVVVSRVESEKVKRLLDASDHPVGEEHWLLLDCGYDTIIEHTLAKWLYRAVAADRADEPADASFRLGGPLCDSGDVFVGELGTPYRRLPAATGVGDVIVFRDVGAYSVDTMTHYNGRPRAAVYGIENGEVLCVLRPETYEDLVANDVWPPQPVDLDAAGAGAGGERS